MFCLIQVDLRHIDETRGTNVVELGVDLSEFYTSVEWDILEVPAVRCIHYTVTMAFGFGINVFVIDLLLFVEQKRKVLHVLRRAVPGHNVQHHDAAQDAVLHGEPDHPVHGHLVPHRAGVLPALGQRREGLALHLHPALAHCVLPPAS